MFRAHARVLGGGALGTRREERKQQHNVSDTGAERGLTWATAGSTSMLSTSGTLSVFFSADGMVITVISLTATSTKRVRSKKNKQNKKRKKLRRFLRDASSGTKVSGNATEAKHCLPTTAGRGETNVCRWRCSPLPPLPTDHPHDDRRPTDANRRRRSRGEETAYAEPLQLYYQRRVVCELRSSKCTYTIAAPRLVRGR